MLQALPIEGGDDPPNADWSQLGDFFKCLEDAWRREGNQEATMSMMAAAVPQAADRAAAAGTDATALRRRQRELAQLGLVGRCVDPARRVSELEDTVGKRDEQIDGVESSKFCVL